MKIGCRIFTVNDFHLSHWLALTNLTQILHLASKGFPSLISDGVRNLKYGSLNQKVRWKCFLSKIVDLFEMDILSKLLF